LGGGWALAVEVCSVAQRLYSIAQLKYNRWQKRRAITNVMQLKHGFCALALHLFCNCEGLAFWS
jgi:hypothetical protein